MSNSKIYLGSTNLGTGKIRLGANDVSAIYLGSSLLYPPSSPADVNYVTITNTSQNSGTFSVYSSDSSFPNYTNLEYSLDGGTTWTTLNTVYDTVTVPSGDSILLRGTGNGEDFDNDEFTKLNFSESHTVSGNLANLVDYTAEPQIVPNYAFYKLFNNDTTLTQANLFDTDFDNGGIDAFDRIFYGCSSLNSVSITTNNWNSSKHDNWLNGAAATGTIYVNGDATNIPLNNTSGVPVGWNVGGDFNELCFTANAANCTVGMTHNGTNQTTTQPVMYYSTDQTNWTLWDYSNITLANVGDKVYFYGNNPNGFSTSSSNYSQFTTSGSVACSGNIMTLITRDGSETTIPSSYCFNSLFNGTSITTTPELPATTLSAACYRGMFQGCTNLTTAPVLQTTTLATGCYQNMLRDCTSLTTAPVLPATTLSGSCYQSMFQGCTNLTIAPELPATKLSSSCYNSIFNGCSQLNYIKVGATSWNSSYSQNWVNGVAATGTFIKPAELTIGTGTGQIPSNSTRGIPTGWTVVDGNMLRFTAEQANSTVGLTIPSGVNLTLYKSTDGTNFDSWDGTAVTLSNVGDKLYVYGNNQTISTYNSYTRFNMTGRIAAAGDITYLLQNGGVTTLPNDYAFYILFYGCTALTTAPDLPATTLTEHCYALMFDSCTNLTTAPALPATTLQANCYEALFKDCTSLTTAPALPATTLATNCYYSMFNGCTSLTTAPELPALTLVDGCYRQMFNNCSNLNSVTCLATDISATDILDVVCTKDWLLNVSATGTFTKNPQMSSWTTGSDGIPTGWTVVDAQ